jgi:hypothetical protein
LPNRSDVIQLLAKGVASAKAGQRAEAYNLFLDVIEIDRRNEQAWLCLSTVTDNLKDQRTCLENVLTINPDNTIARERLAALAVNGNQGDISPRAVICPRCGAGNRDFARECGACGYAFFRRCGSCGDFNLTDASMCSQCGSSLTLSDAQIVQASQQSPTELASVAASVRPMTPITLWPVVAFWVGISLLFIGGGIAASYQFTGIALRARGVVQNLEPNEIAWLPMGLFFIVFGLTGIGLAWQLARRRPGGYYGSLVFGLVLIFLGPISTLVLDPPNYLATVCTGLMPAAAVLFTLASMTGFESGVNHL